MSLRTRDMDKQVQEFIWKLIHDAQMVGNKWLRDGMKPELKERGICKHCDDEVESMDHILFKCKAVGQEYVWELTKVLWNKRCSYWPTPSLATVAAPSFVANPDANEKMRPGDRRLFVVVVPEAARLIWKLRCQRVIDRENESFTRQEVLNRWKEMINRRVRVEKQATAAKYGRSALNKSRVRETWEGLLENENELPEDWTEAAGVLVGIEVGPPSQ